MDEGVAVQLPLSKTFQVDALYKEIVRMRWKPTTLVKQEFLDKIPGRLTGSSSYALNDYLFGEGGAQS